MTVIDPGRAHVSQKKTQRRKAQRLTALAETAWHEAHEEKALRERTWEAVWDEAHEEDALRDAYAEKAWREAYEEKAWREAHEEKAWREAHEEKAQREAAEDEKAWLAAHAEKAWRDMYDLAMVTEKTFWKVHEDMAIREAYAEKAVREAPRPMAPQRESSLGAAAACSLPGA